MNLLIDLGNSCLKWAISDEHLQAQKPLFHADITSSVLKTLWDDLYPHQIAISSVGNKTILSLILQTIDELWGDIPIYFAQSKQQAFGVKNGYFESEKLGIDRWLALIAAWQKTRSAVCIVDCGTAITVDVLNENGEHQGGFICAGLSLMKNALATNTADLPLSVLQHNIGLATDTQTAIFNGTLFAACGLIEKTMSQLPKNTQLLLTGGDALLISKQLNHPFVLEFDLVLQGLALELNSLSSQKIL